MSQFNSHRPSSLEDWTVHEADPDIDPTYLPYEHATYGHRPAYVGPLSWPSASFGLPPVPPDMQLQSQLTADSYLIAQPSDRRDHLGFPFSQAIPRAPSIPSQLSQPQIMAHNTGDASIHDSSHSYLDLSNPGAKLDFTDSQREEVAKIFQKQGHVEPEELFAPDWELPKELQRTPMGSSIIEEDPVIGEFGRRYHRYKAGKYLFPNDGAEQDRLDLQHAAWDVLLANKLYLAPLERSRLKHVIDVAAGTGIWAIAFAEAFPEVQVMGTDLSLIQPSPSKPANCEFRQDDAEDPWDFPHAFDYVHLRAVFSCFDDPRRVMREAYAAMRPGAWIEYHDGNMAEHGSADGEAAIAGSAFQRWGRALIAGLRTALGRDVEVAPRYAEMLREVGFVDVVERRLLWPVSPWHTDKRLRLAGAYMQSNLIDGALLTTWKALRASGLSEDEAHQLIADCKKELTDRTKRFYMVAYVVYGRKP